MKKKLLLASILTLILWIMGFLVLRLPASVHILLALSALLYVRSLLHTSESATQKYYRTKNRNTN